LQNRLIQTNKTGGQWYSDTSPFSIPWYYFINFLLSEKNYLRGQNLKQMRASF
jgi:hypothetical protein